MSLDSIIGSTLDSGWQVTERIQRQPLSSGGTFSKSFKVRKGTRVGFMKTFDIDQLILDLRGDLGTLQNELSSINLEVSLVNECTAAALKNIATAVDTGKFTHPAVNNGRPVDYMVFEIAVRDVRSVLNFRNTIKPSVNLKILLHACNGLRELHSLSIAHQDVKPSNVLVYQNDHSKITDLGRSTKFGTHIWHDAYIFAGDYTYAPPEVLYRHNLTDWHTKRFSADLYMLGNLAVYLFTGVGLTQQLTSNLHISVSPERWKGSFADVLPYLLNAFQTTLKNDKCFSDPALDPLRQIVIELCHPDPLKRGSPKIHRLPHKFSLQRYSSMFDRLLRKTLGA
jgi:serine/threonine protein kinase